MDARYEVRPWKNVVVYADRRDDSTVGLQKALAIASASDGSVTAFDCLEEPPRSLESELSGVALDQLRRAACNRRTAEIVETLSSMAARVPTRVAVRTGMPALELVRHALRTNADIIVKTALGRDVRRLTTFGSLALHLVRKSPIPVWLQNPRTPTSRRVAAAINLGTSSPEQDALSRRILAVARRVAALEGAELHAVYVVDMARERAYRSILTPAQFQVHAETVLRGSRELLERFVESDAPTAIAHLEQGDPKEVLADFVRENGIDLVVMGSVGRSGIAGLLIGELAEELLTRVDCSAITIKPEGFLSPIPV